MGKKWGKRGRGRQPGLEMDPLAMFGPPPAARSAPPASSTPLADYLRRDLPGVDENYVVLPRAVVEGMPLPWQQQMVHLLAQFHDTHARLSWPSYRVVPSRPERLTDLDEEQLAEAGYLVEIDSDGEMVYRERSGRRVEDPENTTVLVSCLDPIVRGRQESRPAPGAEQSRPAPMNIGPQPVWRTAGPPSAPPAAPPLPPPPTAPSMSAGSPAQGGGQSGAAAGDRGEPAAAPSASVDRGSAAAPTGSGTAGGSGTAPSVPEPAAERTASPVRIEPGTPGPAEPRQPEPPAGQQALGEPPNSAGESQASAGSHPGAGHASERPLPGAGPQAAAGSQPSTPQPSGSRVTAGPQAGDVPGPAQPVDQSAATTTGTGSGTPPPAATGPREPGRAEERGWFDELAGSDQPQQGGTGFGPTGDEPTEIPYRYRG